MAFPVEKKFIIRAEEELGIKFPESYRRKLINENGGYIEGEDDDWTFFPVFDDSDRKRITRTANHIVRESKLAKDWDDFPQDGLVIASNGSGDYLILLPDDSDKTRLGESIYLWFHDDGVLEMIAGSIEELIEE